MKGIVTLCGPTRFYEQFDDAMLKLTLSDYAVFTLGSHRGEDSEIRPDVRAHAEQLAALHRRKIVLSKAIVVIDVGGYVGSHTASEVDFARTFGARVYWLTIDGAKPEAPFWKLYRPGDGLLEDLLAEEFRTE